MTLVPWKLQEYFARLKIDRFAAEIDLTRASAGLVGVRLGDDYLADAHLLAVTIPSASNDDIPSASNGDTNAPVECYTR
ncbi:hypothetical protein LCGC14_2348970, partial [marine sediment metagenome]